MRGLKVSVGRGDPPFDPAPPPWRLTGRGVVCVYPRPAPELLRRWVPERFRDAYVGGPAALMLVDYAESGVGPYRELLYVPGRFRLAGGRHPMITRILVSTWESVANGRVNWAIPKELATFSVERSVAGAEHWRVALDGAPLAELRVSARSPRLPVTTSLAPARWLTLGQPRGRSLVCTTLEARAWLRLGRLEQAGFDGDRFPDLGGQRPRLVLVAEPFRMRFPEPERLPLRA